MTLNRDESLKFCRPLLLAMLRLCFKKVVTQPKFETSKKPAVALHLA
jgi:hypothetical protein